MKDKLTSSVGTGPYYFKSTIAGDLALKGCWREIRSRQREAKTGICREQCSLFPFLSQAKIFCKYFMQLKMIAVIGSGRLLARTTVISLLALRLKKSGEMAPGCSLARPLASVPFSCHRPFQRHDTISSWNIMKRLTLRRSIGLRAKSAPPA
jgi:hypothetical protein